MPYLYGIADTKFLFKKQELKKHNFNEFPKIKFRHNSVIAGHVKYDHNASPIEFRVQPASLVELCVGVVDKLPIPSIFEWTDMDIRRWICRYGYPQYMNTFRVNMIWGRKLLLLDADALSAMNIKDFKHIRHILYGIRMMFHFELTKFSRSIALPNEKPNELYFLWHTQTGVNYDAVRRSDLYRRMQIIRERPSNLDHWDMLAMWLRRERERKYTELIAFAPRRNMWRGSKSVAAATTDAPYTDGQMCKSCLPPCECLWTERDTRQPWRLACLSEGEPTLSMTTSRWSAKQSTCARCIPPCECRWPPRYYLTGTVFRCLQQKFPEKFSPIFDEQLASVVRPSLIERWTRFSI